MTNTIKFSEFCVRTDSDHVNVEQHAFLAGWSVGIDHDVDIEDHKILDQSDTIEGSFMRGVAAASDWKAACSKAQDDIRRAYSALSDKLNDYGCVAEPTARPVLPYDL